MKAELKFFFFKCACQQAGGQGENREQKVIWPDIPVHPVQEKKHEDISMEIMISSKKIPPKNTI